MSTEYSIPVTTATSFPFFFSTSKARRPASDANLRLFGFSVPAAASLKSTGARNQLHKAVTSKLGVLNSSLRMDVTQQTGGATPGDDVEQRKISLQNKYGEKLVGILHDTGSKDLVILCHGFRSKKEHYIMVNIATGLEKEGISAFRFDFSGNGESEGSFTYGHYHREADDLYAVVEHFSSLGRNVIAVVGHSKGGDVVLLYASKYHNVHKVVNLSGRFDLHKGIEERLGEDFLDQVNKDGFIDVMQNNEVIYRVTKESLMDRLETDMHEACMAIDKSCRVLTVHGSADEVIPVEDGKEFAKIIPNHRLHIIDGADHCYSQNQAELVSVVVDFIKAGHLQD
uniref:Serine aminopeptidase S33 domain-containing protein n=1 Tax=Kalanchoe fedtschenkoi TaxID=63787 RepID=A0A7N0T2E0_KALFE